MPVFENLQEETTEEELSDDDSGDELEPEFQKMEALLQESFRRHRQFILDTAGQNPVAETFVMNQMVAAANRSHDLKLRLHQLITDARADPEVAVQSWSRMEVLFWGAVGATVFGLVPWFWMCQ